MDRVILNPEAILIWNYKFLQCIYANMLKKDYNINLLNCKYVGKRQHLECVS